MATPLIQVAIDTTSLKSARGLISAARAAGADWIELGKPLVEFVGLNGLADLAADLDGAYVLVDLMVIAGAHKYVRAVADLGYQNVTVTGLAPDETVRETIQAGKELGVDITVDLFNVPDTVARAVVFDQMGADYLMVHFGVDQKRHSPEGSPIRLLGETVAAVRAPVSYATYDLVESRAAIAAGATVIVQGEPLISASDPRAALAEFISKSKSHTEEETAR
jgi:3-hexulose-6-phosphate synthase